MIVLALLLLVLVAAVVAFVLVQGVDQTVLFSADWIGFSWRPSIIVVFLLGALCLFGAELALALMRGGFRRGRDRRRELKRLRDLERQRTAVHAANEQHAATEHHTATGHHDETWHGTTDAAGAHPTPERQQDAWQHGDASWGLHHERPESPSDPDAPTAHRGSWHDDPPGR
jgi:hypothetical protein